MRKLIAIVLVISALLSILVPYTFAAEAEVSEVLADLCTMTFDGKAFDTADYPKNAKDKAVHLIAMTEYGYDKDGGRDDYAVYFYFYNPSGLEFDFDSVKNKIQMGIEWNSENKTVTSDKFRLALCDVSDDPGLQNVYLKYRLVDKTSAYDGKRMAERQKSTRIYNMSGVELLLDGASNATEYELGDSYVVKGFDETESKTMTADRDFVLTVDVEHTYWRSETSYKGANYKQQLNAVYFSIPNEVVKQYGTVNAIHASWYQYETYPIIVTDDIVLYNALLPYRGKPVGFNGKTSKNDAPSYGLYTEWYTADQWEIFRHMLEMYFLYNVNWFAEIGIEYPHSPIKAECWLQTLGWLLLSDDEIEVGKETLVSAEAVTKYLDRFVDQYPLLQDYDANNMDLHYVDKTIQLGDTFTFKNYASTHGWFKGWLDFGFSYFGGYSASAHEIYPEMMPIEVIDYPLGSMSIEQVKEKYHIYEDAEAKAFRNYVNLAYKHGETVVMLRYLQSDYYSEFLNIYEHGDAEKIEGNAFVALQTAVLDFDVLDIYCEEGSVSVVSTPQNFIGGEDAPDKDTSNENVPDNGLKNENSTKRVNWWAIVFAVLGVVAIVVAIPYISKAISSFSKNGSKTKSKKSSGSRNSRSRSRSGKGKSKSKKK